MRDAQPEVVLLAENFRAREYRDGLRRTADPDYALGGQRLGEIALLGQAERAEHQGLVPALGAANARRRSSSIPFCQSCILRFALILGGNLQKRPPILVSVFA
jgi:hypothetical protein